LNHPASITNSDITSIRAIAQQLRVPELSYQIVSAGQLNDELQTFYSNLFQTLDENKSKSVIESLSEALKQPAHPASMNNMAFMCDRIFSVWGRKNRLYSDVNEILLTWRFPLFKLLHQSQNLSCVTKFVALIDMITTNSLAWMPRPERSKKLLLDELNLLTCLLFEALYIDEVLLDRLCNQWQSFINKQSDKANRVIQRLIISESTSSWTQFCEVYAKSSQNSIFLNQSVTASLQCFLEEYWYKVLAGNIKQEINPNFSENLKVLTAKLKSVFCKKGNAAFRWADELLDELQTELALKNIKVSEENWQSLEADLVSILQNNPVAEAQYIPLEIESDISIEAGTELHELVSIGRWLYSFHDSFEYRQQVVAIFPESSEVLCCNYLGIKTERYTFKHLADAFKSGCLKPLKVEESFLEVLKKASTGLLKVASTQKKARIKAAEKAKQEAEALLAEKERAEKAAAIKAKEIAERTKKLLQKRADKQRAEQERGILSQIGNCKLGAWISMNKQDGQGNQSSQRYKLVVKIAATDKFIFVDKLGVKKIELTESMIMKGMLEKEIEILSDGAEFDQSLERVVSRLRASK